MTVTVPASDVANFNLQAQITALATTITANPLQGASLALIKQQLQAQLVNNLMNNNFDGNATGTSHLDPATILSSLTINT
jgi:hypothetical protein